MSWLRRRTARRRLDRVEKLGDLVHVDPGVPDVQEPHLGEVLHLGAVHVHAPADRGPDRADAEPVVPGRDRHAGGEPLHIPVERGGQRLVEVVHVEHQPPVRRCEHAEVQQVRVSAGTAPGCPWWADEPGPRPSARPRRGSRRTARPPSGRAGSVPGPAPGSWPAPRGSRRDPAGPAVATTRHGWTSARSCAARGPVAATLPASVSRGPRTVLPAKPCSCVHPPDVPGAPRAPAVLQGPGYVVPSRLPVRRVVWCPVTAWPICPTPAP